MRTNLLISILIAVLQQTLAQHNEYYDLLKLKNTATTKEIRKAYRKLAKEYHPDVNPSPEAQEKFAAIANAYEALKDTEKRRIYD